MKNVRKSNAGRKPVSDKKIQVSLYIRQSKIEKFGGNEKLKDALYEFVDLRSQSLVFPKENTLEQEASCSKS
jgi:hypothetical protein